MVLFLVLLWSCLVCLSSAFNFGGGCFGMRLRKPWHQISDQERKDYAEGFRKLAEREDGPLWKFTQAHAQWSIHRDPAFLPWHRKFLYEFENAMRKQLNKPCWSLPYWDWTEDIKIYGKSMTRYKIFNNGLGNAPTRWGRRGCVNTDGWDKYQPWSAKKGNVRTYRNCLYRKVCRWGSCDIQLASAAKLELILQKEKFADFAPQLEGPAHGWAHNRIGGILRNPKWSPDDPIFYLLHSMIDMQWTLWQDCRNHENVDKNQINTNMYNGNLDQVLKFSPAFGDVKVRDTIRNKDLGVIYQKGSFWGNANVDKFCNGKIDAKQFTASARRLGVVQIDDAEKSEEAKVMEETFEHLEKQVMRNHKNKNEQMTDKEKKDVAETWARMTCEFETADDPCPRPKYFDDCSSMKRNRKVKWGNKAMDIKISLNKLIKKVKDYPCMVETRRKWFKWARSTGDLWKLCRGDYDKFCDHGFEEEQGDTCRAHKIAVGEWTPPIPGLDDKWPQSQPEDEPQPDDDYDDDDEQDDVWGIDEDEDYDDDDEVNEYSYYDAKPAYYEEYGDDIKDEPIPIYNDYNGKLSPLERILAVMIINGLMFGVVILIFACLYKLKTWCFPSNDKHLYDTVNIDSAAEYS